MAHQSAAAKRAEAERVAAARRRREKIRAWLYLGLISVVILGLAVVLFVVPYLKGRAEDNRIKGLQLAGIGSSAGAAGCRPIRTVPVVAPQAGWHVQPGTHLSYGDAPPAYGKHWSQYLEMSQYRTIFTARDRPPKEQLVHSLEHGHTVVWYDETIANDSKQLAELTKIGDRLVVADGVVIVPWLSSGPNPDGPQFPGGAHLVLTHWAGGGDDGAGVWEYCAGVSGAALKSFMLAYPKSDSPEPDAP